MIFRAESKPGYGRYKEQVAGKNYQISMDDIASGFKFAETLYTSPLVRDTLGGIGSLFDYEKDEKDIIKDAAKARTGPPPGREQLAKSILATALEEQRLAQQEAQDEQGMTQGAQVQPMGMTSAVAPMSTDVGAPMIQPTPTGPPLEIPATSPTGMGAPPAGIITPAPAVPPHQLTELEPISIEEIQRRFKYIEGQRDRLYNSNVVLNDPGTPIEVQDQMREIIQQGQVSAKSDIQNMAADIVEIVQNPSHPLHAEMRNQMLEISRAPAGHQPQSAEETVYLLALEMLRADQSYMQPVGQQIAGVGIGVPGATQPAPVTAPQPLPNDIDQLIGMLREAGAPTKVIGNIQWHKLNSKNIPAGIQKAQALLAQMGAAPAPAPAATGLPMSGDPMVSAEQLELGPPAAPLPIQYQGTTPTREDQQRLAHQGAQRVEGAVAEATQQEIYIRKQLEQQFASYPKWNQLTQDRQEAAIQSAMDILGQGAPAAPPVEPITSRFRIPRGANIGQAQAIVAGLARSGGSEEDFIKVINEGLGNISGVYTGGWGRWLSGGRPGGYFTNPDKVAALLYQTYESAKTSGPKAEKAALQNVILQHKAAEALGGRGTAKAKRENIQERTRSAAARRLERDALRPYKIAKAIADLGKVEASTAKTMKGLISWTKKPGKTPSAVSLNAKDLTAYRGELKADIKSLQKFTQTYGKQTKTKIQTAKAKATALEANPSTPYVLNSDEVAQLYGTNTGAYQNDQIKAKDKAAGRKILVAELRQKISALESQQYQVNQLGADINAIKHDITDTIKLPVKTQDERAAKLSELSDLQEALRDKEDRLNDLVGGVARE